MRRLLILLALSLSTPTALAEIGTGPGQTYPDLTLTALDGTPVRIGAFRGRKLLLVHFASW